MSKYVNIQKLNSTSMVFSLLYSHIYNLTPEIISEIFWEIGITRPRNNINIKSSHDLIPRRKAAFFCIFR